MTVAIIDYGMGNLGSVARALAELGARPVVAERPEQLAQAARLVLPGVGSFADGMAHLEERGWTAALRAEVRAGKPLLGICLGMQLLGARGTEGGDTPGLDLIPGEVRRLDTLGCARRIPHVGWNAIALAGAGGALFADIPGGSDFYFVHSYAFVPAAPEDVVAWTDYGLPVVAAVARGRVFGTQFHPEKSSRAGLRLLKNFLEAPAC